MEDTRTAVGASGAGLGRAAVCAAALTVPLVYVPGLESPFLEPKLALLLFTGALALGGELVARAAGAPGPRWRVSMGGALLALLGTTILSAALAVRRGPPGAPYARDELARLVAMLGVAAGAARAADDPVWRRRLCDAIAVSAGVVSLLGLLQHVRLLPFALPVISVPGSTFGNRNMAGEAIALSIPFGLAALRMRAGSPAPSRPAAALLVLSLVFLAVTRTRGAWLGGAAGAAVFLLVRRPSLPRGVRLAALPLGAIVLAAALLPGRWLARDAQDAKRYEPGARVLYEAVDPVSPVTRTRLGLWRRTLAMYGAHPLTGVGPGNFPIWFPLYAEPGAAADGVMSPKLVPRRPHDEVLERLAEDGPLGLAALLAVYLAAFGAAGSWRRAGGRGDAREPDDEIPPADAAAAGAGCVAAAAACGLTAFPLGMPATTLLFGVALGLLGTLRPGSERAQTAALPAGRVALRPGAVLLAACALVVMAGGAGLLAARRIVASTWRGRAERALASRDSKAGAGAALPLLARADRAGADSARFWIALRTAQAALRLGSGGQAERAAERALEVEPHSPQAWALRGAGRLAAGDARGAADDSRRALALLADYPGALYTFSAASARLGQAADAQTARAHLGELAARDDDARRLLAQLGKGP